MLLGRYLRFVQELRSNMVRAVKPSIDEDGTFLIAVRHNIRFDRLFIIPVNFGNELITGQSSRSRSVRDCISAVMVGRSMSDLQCFRCKYLSLLSCPIDGWISTKLSHPERSSFSSIGTPEKSGVLMSSVE